MKTKYDYIEEITALLVSLTLWQERLELSSNPDYRGRLSADSSIIANKFLADCPCCQYVFGTTFPNERPWEETINRCKRECPVLWDWNSTQLQAKMGGQRARGYYCNPVYWKANRMINLDSLTGLVSYDELQQALAGTSRRGPGDKGFDSNQTVVRETC